jgi:hypothetical protein
MRRAAFALALPVALAATVLAPTGAGQTAARPSLQLMDTAALTVRGTGFRAREHVRLVVRAPGLVTRNTTAGTGGGFTMRLAGMSAGSCTGFSVTATGDQGSRATLKRAPGQCALP